MSMRDFHIHSKIGEGAYSVVYKVRRLSDSQEYALKKVRMGNLSAKEKENAVNEVRILASFEHPNIVSYKETFFEDNTSSLCIVMEYADGGDLYARILEHTKKISHFPEEQIWKVFIQTVKGLKALHDHNILHRDLKSANVFLTKDGRAKLGDLNVSKIAKKGLLYTQTGTPYYASPEVWKDLPYDTKSDIWSLGCVMYEAATLKPPFRAQSMEALNQRVQKGIYPKIPSIYSEDLSNMIKALLQVNPKKRPSCDEILKMAVIRKKIAEFGLEEDGIEKKSLAGNELLGTIQIPRNLKILRDKLPKPHYRKIIEESEEPSEASLPHVVHRNKSTKANRSGLHIVDPELIHGNVVSANRCSVEQKLKSVIKASHQPVPSQSPPESYRRPIEPLRENPTEERGVKLPDIRRAAAPIKRPPPRVYPNNLSKNQSDLADIYIQPQIHRIGPEHVKANPYSVEHNDRSARLKKIYEDINRHKAGYYALPSEKPKPPVIQNVYHNAYHIYQQPVIVRPSWWG